MENASKALLIAAAVLIAILLIAFGMNIFNSTTGTADSVKTTMNATEITTFNSKFTSFRGTKSFAQVSALVDKIIANNAINRDNINKIVSFNGETDSSGITEQLNSLSEEGATRFIVEVPYDTDGLVRNITVEAE